MTDTVPQTPLPKGVWVELVLLLVGEIVKSYPTLSVELKNILNKPDATDDDWRAFAARANAKSYEDYDPNFVPPVPPDNG